MDDNALMPQNFVGAAPTATMGTSSSTAQPTQPQAMMWQPTQLGQPNAAAQPNFHALNQPQAQQQPHATTIPLPAAATAQLTPQQQQEMMNQFAQHAAMFNAFMQSESNPHTQQAQANSGATSLPTMVPPVANPMGTTAATPFAMGDFATMGATVSGTPSTSTAPVTASATAASDAFMAGAASAAAAAVAAADAARLAQQQPTFVNAKQYMRIMKRRETRQALELYFARMNARKAELTGQVANNRKDAPFQHLSRHNHAKKRPRGKHGRFLTGEELAEYYRQNPDKDPNNPSSNAGEEQPMDHLTADVKVAAVAATPKPANVVLASATPMAAKQDDDDDEPTTHPGLQVSPIVLPPLNAATAASAPLAASPRENSIDPLLSEAAEALREGEDEDDAQHPAKKQALDSSSL
jgi:CCAAT-binding transcription factor (CBF-B/NF-YA) subunit B